MQNSIRKYLEKPLVEQTSFVTFDKINKPVIYICQDDQFNYTLAKMHGYNSMNQFTFGELKNLNTTKITWNEGHENETYKDLQSALFRPNYTEYPKIFGSDKYKHNEAVETKDMVYLVPLGFCLRITMSNRFMLIKTDKKSTIYFTDPLKMNNLKVSQMKDGKFTLSPHENKLYDSKVYKIMLSIYNTQINDGQKCIDYEKKGTSYGECIDSSIGELFLSLYGCLPPWFPNSGKMGCGKNQEIEVPEEDYFEFIRKDYVNFYYELDLKIIKQCLPPCTSMGLEFIDTSQISNIEDYSTGRFNIENEIPVYSKVVAYDMFSLVVDLGSALGLWLGLSALSVLDTLVDIMYAIKEKTVNFRFC